MTTAADITALLREEATITDLRDALHRARRQLTNIEERQAQLIDAVYLAAKDAALSHPLPPTIKPTPPKKGVKPEVGLLHLTDLQYGKRTSTYSPEVCEQRIGLAIRKTLDITTIQRATRPVDEIHVMLGGDMVEGMTIYPTQVHEISIGLYEQMFGVARLISTTIATLREHFARVHVWEEYGNHGRIGKYGELPAKENIDRMAYQVARDHLPPSTGLIWHPATSWFQNVRIGNYSALLVHGDEIKSFGGNHPSYGIVKKVSAWQAGVLPPFTDAYMGHFHRPDCYTLPGAGSIFITGSPEDSNEYAAEFVAAKGRPSQRLHFVDPEAGRVTAEYRLWLDS